MLSHRDNLFVALDVKKEIRFMLPNVLIIGNPNSGKTTLFNKLTGLHYKVANYPGVTVEKKSGKVKIDDDTSINLVDLPGIYSLTGLSIDEKIAISALTDEKDSPALCLIIADSTNLERNLFLATEILDLKIPSILILTMRDIAEKNHITIYQELLSRELDIPVVGVSSIKNTGFKELNLCIKKQLTTKKISSKLQEWKTRVVDLDKDINLNPSSSSQLKTKSQEEIETQDATARYFWINKLIEKTVHVDEPFNRTQRERSILEKINVLTTHRFWGVIIFLFIMSFLFQSIYLFAEIPMQGIELLVGKLAEFLSKILPKGDLKSLIIDGAVAGVGNVLIFIPQIAILVFMLTLLEDSGYLARAAFLMDRIFRPFGLQGRSFVPLLSSFACAIPGIISTRTIANRSDRLATILIAPLMSCSARLPVYTVLIGACIPHELVFGIFSLQGITLLSMYLLGIVAALLVSLVLKLTILKGKPSLFVMEMPPFRRPKITNGIREAFDRSRDFIQSAGSMILACSILLWALASYPKYDDANTNGVSLTKSEQLKMSYAGQIGTVIEPVIKPLGFDWQIGVAILTSFAAREVFVSTLATMYNIGEDSKGEEDDGGSLSLKDRIQAKNISGEFTTATAVSLMIFYVFACQCMSTLAICKRETGHWGWSVLMFCYMTVLAYLGSWGWYSLNNLIDF